jgi:cobalt/nickel transport system permease protein
MIHRICFILYLAAVLLITSIHNILFYLIALAALLAAARRDFAKIAKRAFLAVAIFNSIITISYVVITMIRGNFSPHYVVLINLRVFLLTFMTFLFVGRINPFQALAFSRSLQYLLILAYSQVLTLRRLFEEFRLALKSRSPARPAARDLYRHGASTGAFLLRKSLSDTADITQAMKSRGFFND